MTGLNTMSIPVYEEGQKSPKRRMTYRQLELLLGLIDCNDGDFQRDLVFTT